MQMFYAGNQSVVAPELEFAAGELDAFLERLNRMRTSGRFDQDNESDSEDPDCEEIDPKEAGKDAAREALGKRKSGKSGGDGNPTDKAKNRYTRPFKELAGGMMAYQQRLLKKEEREEKDREERVKRQLQMDEDRKEREAELLNIKKEQMGLERERLALERDHMERESKLREKDQENEKIRLQNESLQLQLQLMESKKMSSVMGKGMSLLAKKFGLLEDGSENE
jgi:hypothetical protein